MLNKFINWLTYRKFSWYVLGGKLHLYIPYEINFGYMHVEVLFNEYFPHAVYLNGRKIRCAYQEKPVFDIVITDVE